MLSAGPWGVQGLDGRGHVATLLTTNPGTAHENSPDAGVTEF